MSENINNSNVLIAYLDLLGYSDLVKENPEPEKYYKIINGLLIDFEQFMSPEPGQDIGKSAEITKKCFSLNLWSDSFLVALDQEKLCKEEGISRETAIWRFFAITSKLTRGIFCSTQLLVRGAITQEQYYQQKFSAFSQSEFIYSKALCKAAWIEKNIANTPRIIIDQQLAKDFMCYKPGFYFNDTQYSQLLKDSDGSCYLNVYWWEINNKDKRMNLLQETAEVLRNNISKYLDDPVRIRKWTWAANYHNEMISRLQKGTEKDNPTIVGIYKISLTT